MSRFKSGDTVRIVRKSEKHIKWNSDGEMDKLIGTIAIVEGAFDSRDYCTCLCVGNTHWTFDDTCLELHEQDTLSTADNKLEVA